MLSEDNADILAGNLAGWAFVTVAQPLDYIKTMYQVKDYHLPSIREIYSEIGFKGLYKGASTIYLFSGAITAL